MAPIVDRRGKGGDPWEWARILAYITGTVDQELRLRNEYLVAENRILKSQLNGRLRPRGRGLQRNVIDNDGRVFEIDFVASAVGAAQDVGHHET